MKEYVVRFFDMEVRLAEESGAIFAEVDGLLSILGFPPRVVDELLVKRYDRHGLIFLDGKMFVHLTYITALLNYFETNYGFTDVIKRNMLRYDMIKRSFANVLLKEYVRIISRNAFVLGSAATINKMSKNTEEEMSVTKPKELKRIHFTKKYLSLDEIPFLSEIINLTPGAKTAIHNQLKKISGELNCEVRDKKYAEKVVGKFKEMLDSDPEYLKKYRKN